MSILALGMVLSTMHFEGDVTGDGGDYVDVQFPVPAGTVEIEIAHTDGSPDVILDWGAWSPDGFRGWGGGLEDDAIIGVDQSSRGYLPGPITPGMWTAEIGKAKLLANMGHYSIDVTCRDNATLTVLPKAPFTPVVLSPDRRWYKGDFHVHSSESGDAMASFLQITALAQSRGLDFVNISDHNTVSQHALIAALQPMFPSFLILRGAEITTYTGHGNAVGLHDYIDHRLGRDNRTVAGIAADVAAQGGIFIVNHPMLDLGTVCIGCAWKHVDDTPWDQVQGMEIITGNYDAGVTAFVPRVLTLWDSLLDQGYRLAAMGGSDDHTAGTSTGPTASEIGSPTVLVLADNLSEAAIMDAVRAGRTIVQLSGPDDPLVEFTMKTKTGVAEIGDTVDQIARAQFTAHVTGGDGTFVQLWRNGKLVAHQAVVGDDFTTTFEDAPEVGTTPTRYRLHVIDGASRPLVVTSHIYATGAVEAGGCGCRSTSPGGALPLALCLLALRRRRRYL